MAAFELPKGLNYEVALELLKMVAADQDITAAVQELKESWPA